MSKIKAFYTFFFKNIVLPLKEKPQKQRFHFVHASNDPKFDGDIATPPHSSPKFGKGIRGFGARGQISGLIVS